MPTPVVIVEYDAAWPRSFIDIADTLRSLLGKNALEIDHVGSTAVPNLAAKPLIDIDVTFADRKDIDKAADCLVEAGYEARGNRHGDDMLAFLKKAPSACRVYLCLPGNETHRKRLLFRDRLCRDGELALAYAALKRDLSRQFRLDGDAYTAAKKEFIDRVLSLPSP